MTHNSTSSARWGVLVLLSVVLGAALWLFVLRPSERASGVQPEARGLAEAALNTPPFAEVSAEPAAAAARVAVPAPPEAPVELAGELDAAAEDEPEPAEGDWIDVEVVYAADGRPAPEAEVLLVELTAARRISMAAAISRGDSVETLLRSMGTTHAVDSSAKVRVPIGNRDNSVVAALAEGHLALREEMDGNGPHVLELQPIRTYGARVVDGQGAPLPGILVTLRVIDGDDRSDTFTALSDTNGLVRLGIPETMLEQLAADLGGDPDVQLALAAKGLFLEPVEVLLDPELAGGEPPGLETSRHQV